MVCPSIKIFTHPFEWLNKPFERFKYCSLTVRHLCILPFEQFSISVRFAFQGHIYEQNCSKNSPPAERIPLQIKVNLTQMHVHN